MTKPIFIIQLPKKYLIHIDDFIRTLGEQLKDYHVIVLESQSKDYKFECFNPNNLEGINKEYYLDIVKQSIESPNL